MKLWLALFVAILAHVGLGLALWVWSGRTESVLEPDFVSTSFITDELTPGPIGPSVCPVHHVMMTIAEVPIVYGLLLEFSDPAAFHRANPDEPPRAIRTTQFPYAERWKWGGCCVTETRNARIYVCTECERAEKEWKLAYQQ